MIDFRRCEELYRNDAPFKHLVDTMVHFIETMQFEQGELRTAAIFATYVHMSRHRPTFQIVLDDLKERLDP